MAKRWISMHIFYYGNPNGLIVNCLAPLIERLRARSLIQRHFFIKYWMEGPHVRLRLLARDETVESEIKACAEQAVTTYLQRHPALYKPDQKNLGPYYKNLFIAEYGQEQWQQQYGEEGEIRIRPNNSFAYIDYEPEYYRYGGPEGVELAEWHFEYSSDLIIQLLQRTNVRVHTILLGLAVQIFLPLCYGFFESDEGVIDALERYIDYWQSNYRNKNDFEAYDRKYRRMAADLQQRVSWVKQYMGDGFIGELTDIERNWKAHIHALRDRVDTFSIRRRMHVLKGLPSVEEAAVDVPLGQNARKDVYHILLNSYIHMNNNRLGVTIPQEVYLAYMLKCAVEEHNTQEVPA